jgi:hypothetical protein
METRSSVLPSLPSATFSRNAANTGQTLPYQPTVDQKHPELWPIQTKVWNFYLNYVLFPSFSPSSLYFMSFLGALATKSCKHGPSIFATCQQVIREVPNGFTLILTSGRHRTTIMGTLHEDLRVFLD